VSAGGDVYDLQDYALAAANGRAPGGVLLDVGAGPVSDSRARAVGGMGVGAPANRVYPGTFDTTGGGVMTKTNLRTLAFYLAVGAVVVFSVAHLAPIRGR
jgi:hypothetical protein